MSKVVVVKKPVCGSGKGAMGSKAKKPYGNGGGYNG